MADDLDEPTPCGGCGRTDILDGDNPAAHWDTPHGHTIVAWSCSDACQETVEAQRSPEGVLVAPEGGRVAYEVPSVAQVESYVVFCHCKPPTLDENDRCTRCGIQWAKESK